MYLLVKGRKARVICRACKALHAERECPRSDEAKWRAAAEHAEKVYKRVVAYQERILRNG